MADDKNEKAAHTLTDHLYGRDVVHIHPDNSDHDHDHDFDVDDGPLEDNPLWRQDNVTLMTVGIDIGSSGTQVVFSRVHLRRLAEDLTSRYYVVSRETLFQSPVALTPYQNEERIDDAKLGAIIDDAYVAAGISPDQIDITAWDPGQATGTYHITVTSPGGTSTTSSADEFTDNTTSLPTLTGLSTTSGTTVGGTALTLTGTGFSMASVVNFGGTAITNFTINSDTQITLLTPPAVAGVFDVSVTTAAGTTATSLQHAVFGQRRFRARRHQPRHQLRLHGRRHHHYRQWLGLHVRDSVMFGALPAASFTVVSDSVITAVSPAAGRRHRGRQGVFLLRRLGVGLRRTSLRIPRPALPASPAWPPPAAAPPAAHL